MVFILLYTKYFSVYFPKANSLFKSKKKKDNDNIDNLNLLIDTSLVIENEYEDLNFIANTKSIKIRESNPVTLLTKNILSVFRQNDTDYFYEETMNPRRELTDPAEGVFNENRDNVNYDLIICVQDIITSHNGKEYKIIDLLGNYNIN